MSLTNIFSIGVSGINAYSNALSDVSTNIANSQSVGYKKTRTDFNQLIPNDVPSLNDAIGSTAIGGGVGTTTQLLASEQGNILRTDQPGNIAISGRGYFTVADQTSSNSGSPDIRFTRAGDFTLRDNGFLVNGNGDVLQGTRTTGPGQSTATTLGGLTAVNLQTTASSGQNLASFRIDPDGTVVAEYTSGTEETLFRLPVALFRNAGGLERAEGTAFRATTQSGNAALVDPGSQGSGQIEDRAIEASTVDIGEEFSRLISTQQAYSTNSRILSVADEFWRTIVDTAA
ncbi:MAG: flagellar hook basal-body protein [Pseudomonadota bacterium]